VVFVLSFQARGVRIVGVKLESLAGCRKGLGSPTALAAEGSSSFIFRKF